MGTTIPIRRFTLLRSSCKYYCRLHCTFLINIFGQSKDLLQVQTVCSTKYGIATASFSLRFAQNSPNHSLPLLHTCNHHHYRTYWLTNYSSFLYKFNKNGNYYDIQIDNGKRRMTLTFPFDSFNFYFNIFILTFDTRNFPWSNHAHFLIAMRQCVGCS